MNFYKSASAYKLYFSQMNLCTVLSGLPDAGCKELFVVQKCLRLWGWVKYLVFSYEVFSHQLSVTASDLDLHIHLTGWMCGKIASPSRKCAALLFSSSAIHIGAD